MSWGSESNSHSKIYIMNARLYISLIYALSVLDVGYF